MSVGKGRLPFIKGAVFVIKGFCKSGHENWKRLGPWWPVAQELINAYGNEPDGPQNDWNEGGPPPSFLLRYNYRDDKLNAAAVVAYLDELGDYLPETDSAHTIVLPAGGYGSYVPGTGLVEA
jgi:hypothetical protein